MVSEVLNTHPDVLSLSEFFISLGMKSLIRKRLGGKALWGICCRHSPGLRATLLSGNRDRIRYPLDKLRQLIAFIDPSLADDAWLDDAAQVPRPNPPKYLSLDPEAQRRLTAACAPGLEALGYEA